VTTAPWTENYFTLADDSIECFGAIKTKRGAIEKDRQGLAGSNAKLYRSASL
jgi:hypothetical protein